MRTDTKLVEDGLHLREIVETYTDTYKTLYQSLIVWTPSMHEEEANYWRGQVPPNFRLYKIARYYDDGFYVNYPPDDIWYWTDDPIE